MKFKIVLSSLLLLGAFKAFAQLPYVGEIRVFAGNFAPVGWVFCDGRLLSIVENEILFNVIGTTYGGDGITTFAVPDLRGRVPVHKGNGFLLGQAAGTESVTLTTQEIPQHIHTISKGFTGGVNTDAATSTSPQGKVIAITKQNNFTQESPNVEMQPARLNEVQIQAVGGAQPHENMAPTTTVHFIISINGIFPSGS